MMKFLLFLVFHYLPFGFDVVDQCSVKANDIEREISLLVEDAEIAPEPMIGLAAFDAKSR